MVKGGAPKHWYFLALLAVLLYLSFLIIKPFFSYFFLALILTYFCYPLFQKFKKKTGNDTSASFLTIIAVLLIVLIPSVYILNTLVDQATSAISDFDSDEAENFLTLLGFEKEESDGFVQNAMLKVKDFVVNNGSQILGSVTDGLLGIFILFFIMYYGLKEGPHIYKWMMKYVPFETKHKSKLMNETTEIIDAVLFGQFMIAIIQGLLGGIGFWIAGVSSPVFWGFIMMIMSFLPVIGSFLIWVPAGLILIAQGNTAAGIGLLLYGLIVISNIDNILRPRLVSSKANVHPVVVMLGVLGGLAVFGFAGFILGPLILALAVNLTKVYAEDDL